jgi:Zn-dependent oligopeptidase
VLLWRSEQTIGLDKQDVTALWNDLREQVSLVKYNKRTAGQGSFGHIVGGYDAGYYGCVSQVLCVSS